jgi:hypothetical protein
VEVEIREATANDALVVARVYIDSAREEQRNRIRR